MVKIYATSDATVRDLMANVGSDAIRLKGSADEFGQCVSDHPQTLLHDLDSQCSCIVLHP